MSENWSDKMFSFKAECLRCKHAKFVHMSVPIPDMPGHFKWEDSTMRCDWLNREMPHDSVGCVEFKIRRSLLKRIRKNCEA